MTLFYSRSRWIVLAFLLALLVLMLLARPARAEWSADPVQVHATSALCPQVSVCADGHYGAIVVWQENTASGGFLKARHLLASGDLDPAWSAPAAVSNRAADRVALGAVSDGSGGAYVWWMENAALSLTHLDLAGRVTAGWPAAGRFLGALPSSRHRPAALSDGAGGVYVGWLVTPLLADPTASVRVVHLGPSNAGAGGWPSGGRTFGMTGDPGIAVVSFGLDAATGGGLWLAWQTLVFEGGTGLPGEVRALRVTSAGLPAAGWTVGGVPLAAYDPAFLQQNPGWSIPPAAGQIAVCNDGGSGAFIVVSQGIGGAEALEFRNTLRRVDALGGTAAGWTSAGVDLGDVYAPGLPDPGAQASVRALTDDRGGALAGLPWFASENTAVLSFSRRGSDGSPLPGGIGSDQRGIEFAPRGDGGMFIASFKPSGATGPYEADAYVSAAQSAPGAGFYESKISYYATRYGDIALAATGDGGAIFAWSQLIDRQGVFAIRLSPAGVVTGVPPTPVIGSPSLRLRFVLGEGVHAVASFAGSPRIAFALHDLAGRRVAGVTSEATLGADVLIPGTRNLPGGVYFMRASDGASELRRKVIVMR